MNSCKPVIVLNGTSTPWCLHNKFSVDSIRPVLLFSLWVISTDCKGNIGLNYVGTYFHILNASLVLLGGGGANLFCGCNSAIIRIVGYLCNICASFCEH